MLLMASIALFDILSILLLAGGERFIMGLSRLSAYVFSTLVTVSVAAIVFTASLFDIPTMLISMTTVPPGLSLSYVSISASIGVAPSTRKILELSLLSQGVVLLIFALTPLISYIGRIEVEYPGTLIKLELTGIYALAFISFSITASIVSLMSMILKKEWEKRWALILPSFMTTIFSLTNPNIWFRAFEYAKENIIVALLLWVFCAYLITMAYIQLT